MSGSAWGAAIERMGSVPSTARTSVFAYAYAIDNSSITYPAALQNARRAPIHACERAKTYGNARDVE